MNTKEQKPKRRAVAYHWNGKEIRALRQHMKLTQHEMADELQVRQQTISEWETDLHKPHRSTQKMLSMIAERVGFAYQTGATESSAESSEGATQA